ncbi:MAG: sugar transferase [Vicinamibacterales bacterium]
MKRLLDIVGAGLGLLLGAPLMAVAALAIKLESKGPAVFTQTRVGRDFVPFRLYKLRTMRHDADVAGPSITVAGDERVTRVGAVLRATKLDEIPQFFNVLRGDMSLVGPRPEVPEYVEMFRKDYEQLLRVRPGLTDPGSIAYRNEAAVLASAADSQAAYVAHVLPEKIRLAGEYVSRPPSVWRDLGVLLRTAVAVFRG